MWTDLLVSHPNHAVFVAEHDEKGVIGFSSGGKERSGKPTCLGELYAIYVLNESQRSGIGRALTGAVVNKWFTAVNGAAMIIGGVLAMRFSKKIPPQRLLMLGQLVNVGTFVCFAFATNLWLSLGAQFLSGLVMPGLQIGINTMILQNAEEDFVGRVTGTLNPLFMGGMVVSMTLSGWLKG